MGFPRKRAIKIAIDVLTKLKNENLDFSIVNIRIVEEIVRRGTRWYCLTCKNEKDWEEVFLRNLKALNKDKGREVTETKCAEAIMKIFSKKYQETFL